MQIEVKLSGFLQRIGLPNGFRGGALEVADDANVSDALALLQIDERSPWLITHNDQLASRAAALQNGDKLVIIPPISGGTN
jgi:sulfur carrier protein ThiS